MLYDISCDFVARTCSSKYALELFEKFLEYEFDDIHRHDPHHALVDQRSEEVRRRIGPNAGENAEQYNSSLET